MSSRRRAFSRLARAGSKAQRRAVDRESPRARRSRLRRGTAVDAPVLHTAVGTPAYGGLRPASASTVIQRHSATEPSGHGVPRRPRDPRLTALSAVSAPPRPRRCKASDRRTPPTIAGTSQVMTLPVVPARQPPLSRPRNVLRVRDATCVLWCNAARATAIHAKIGDFSVRKPLSVRDPCDPPLEDPATRHPPEETPARADSPAAPTASPARAGALAHQ
jgi:hypothetical protein